MVIAVPILAAVLALPTGLLFGVGYGNGVRIGYEQIYPLLFPSDKSDKGKLLRKRGIATTTSNMNMIQKIYDTLGGSEASKMGIAVGLNAAMSEIDKNPDFQDLLQLEYELSGNTPSNYVRSRYGLDNISQLSNEDIQQHQDATQEGTTVQEQGEKAAHIDEENAFRNQMESLTDEKLKKFYKQKDRRYDKLWKRKIITLVYKIRFGNEPMDLGQDGRNLPENRIQVVTFSYQHHVKGRLTQSYKGNFRWHKHKIKQIAGQMKTLTPNSKFRKTMQALILSYLNKIGFYWNIPFSVL